MGDTEEQRMRKNNDRMTTAQAIELFDSLPPARADQMIGRWRGEGIDTDHPRDGLLEASYWHGKDFQSHEAVYPLIHTLPIWGRVAVNPAMIPMTLVEVLPLRDWITPVLFPIIYPLMRTSKPKARLRTIEFRGRPHAAMLYDAKPIHDIFAKLDDDTMMGWMDFRGMEQPYFFKLHREV
ncbi:hypothetical protein C1H70_09730 [Halomonas urumqiensis]|uniref:DUF4334 domain-containing protein n=2 Tax=Halomonas urumqiensis TaxID=1684789 RepID=A0A2N7UI22_9GAMM|nr:hypothetical protein C1H70_09730 [Halomonas urumqiensis]PTB01276.1 DUF4334 domain-containing protein [Halomonas urumqiensis]